MRVITGTARGRRLKEPSNYDIRPTTDKVKESMFNIVQFSVEGAHVLDLFAGTGQLGIEALSRGAEHAVFVDKSPEAIKIVRENLETTGLADRARVVRTDSLMFLRSGEKFDLIFLDPPFAAGLLEKALDLATGFDILKENGIIMCESDINTALPEPSRSEYSRREYHYGKIKLTTFTKDRF
ncbi:MAG: 16S rRNA (guanine(966)-N(2))-methyltransferase RsmD [Oscillospiraceae bacterium]